MAKIMIAIRMIRHLRRIVERKGLTFRIRLTNETRYALSTGATASSVNITHRSKKVLTEFLEKSGAFMIFKSCTHEFLEQIYKINAQMHSRLLSHRLRMEHLNSMFERELHILKQHFYKSLKSKKKNR